MGPDPILDLAGSNENLAHEFSGVRDATVLPDDRIAVVDRDTREIRLFSSSGKFVFSVGRDGEGPGEFRGPISVDLYRADSLVVYDLDLQRATVLAPNGTVARVFRLPSGEIVGALFPLNDGRFLARQFWEGIEGYQGNLGVFVRPPVPLLLLSRKGSVVDTVAVLPGTEVFMTAIGEAMRPFQKDSHVGVHAGAIFTGDSRELKYQVFNPRGQLERIVRVPSYDVEITEEDLGKEVEASYPPNPPPRVLRSFSQLPRPETKPAYSDLLVDTEGYVWLEEYRHRWAVRTQQVSDWNVFSPSGEWLGSVRFPPRFQVFEIGPDYVLGVWWDELDVEHPQLLRLNRH